MTHQNPIAVRQAIPLLTAALIVLASTLPARAFDFRENERVVLIGNTFAERMQHYGYFEALLQFRRSKLGVTVRNMGWSGDEVGLMPRPLNFEGGAGNLYANDTRVGYDVPKSTEVDFKMLKAHLAAQDADSIFLCFGANESFKGEKGLKSFSEDYRVLIDQLRAQPFNGKAPPRLVLVTPIPQEKLGAPYPDPRDRNEMLRLYAERVVAIAKENGLEVADIFAPVDQLMKAAHSSPYTIDGLQLNAEGQRAVAEILVASLGINAAWSEELDPLRKIVVEKNKQFFFRWRPINGEYVFGRRKEPFGVVTFPPEMKQWEEMTEALDGQIHAEARKLGSPE